MVFAARRRCAISRAAPRRAIGLTDSAPFEIRKTETADILDGIAKGARDFIRAPRYGMFFGAIGAIDGW
jgi:hypothetical protein